MKKTILFLFLFTGIVGFSNQNWDGEAYETAKAKFDSINSLPDDVTKVQLLNDLAWQTKYIDLELTRKVVETSILIADQNEFHSEAGMAYKIAGIVSDESGKYNEAIQNYLQAIEYYKLAEDEMGIAKCEGNIGIIYRTLKKYDEAIDYFKSSFATFVQNDFVYGKMLISSNIGICFLEMGLNDSSMYYHNMAEKFMVEADIFDPSIVGNKALVMLSNGDYDAAIPSLEKTVEFFHQNDPNGYRVKVWLQNLGLAYENVGRYPEAKQVLAEAWEITGDDYYNREATYLIKTMGEVHASLAEFKDAYTYYKLLDKVKDSIYSVENLEQINDMKEKYETEKKELKIKTLDQEKKLEQARADQEENKVFYFTIGSILMGILLILVIAAFVVKAKDNKKIKNQNQLITDQKSALQLKNEEILSSIEYAKRIQTAILPPDRLVKSYFENSFVLYKPKDIVAGDFYWFESTNDHVIFAAADCTGHGVPGAMVSVVCHNALNRAVREFGLTDPGKILDKTTQVVVQQFEKSEESVKDGMDIALCSLSLKENVLRYAGAHNPLWIVRNNSTEIEEIKGNKQPVGKFDDLKSFDSHNINLNPGDTVYLFSDGYADQFGGENGKKFKSKALKSLIESVQNETMSKQREILERTFEQWRGELEQLDDVCVIGVRV